MTYSCIKTHSNKSQDFQYIPEKTHLGIYGVLMFLSEFTLCLEMFNLSRVTHLSHLCHFGIEKLAHLSDFWLFGIKIWHTSHTCGSLESQIWHTSRTFGSLGSKVGTPSLGPSESEMGIPLTLFGYLLSNLKSFSWRYPTNNPNDITTCQCPKCTVAAFCVSNWISNF